MCNAGAIGRELYASSDWLVLMAQVFARVLICFFQNCNTESNPSMSHHETNAICFNHAIQMTEAKKMDAWVIFACVDAIIYVYFFNILPNQTVNLIIMTCYICSNSCAWLHQSQLSQISACSLSCADQCWLWGINLKTGMAKTKAMIVRSTALPTQAGERGSSERVSSPSCSPKSVVGTFGLESIPVTWDNDHQIRDRIRLNENLTMRFNSSLGKTETGFVEATPENCRVNAPVLKPLLTIMRENDLQLPAIPTIINAIESFYQLSKVVRSSDQVYQESWAIRRLIGKMKKFAYRQSPPQDCFIP